MSQPDLDSACRASLDRSRRRRDVARRLRTRRLRTRGGGSTFAVAAATIALSAPFAVAAGGGGSAGGLLKNGASGSAVTQVQQALGIQQTGTYDAATRRAVRAFQRAHGLEVDGIVGPATRGALGIGTGVANAASATGGEIAGGDIASASTDAATAKLAKIAACESGGNPAAVSPDGRYRGKYQFSRSTWRAMGGSGDPAKAPEAEQDERAAALLASAGKRPWPNCA